VRLRSLLFEDAPLLFNMCQNNVSQYTETLEFSMD
jgi:hypothetical protein